MIGAIIGDVVGSAFEFDNIKTKSFPLFSERSCFTDDTVMTCAVAESLMRSKKENYLNLREVAIDTFHEIGRMYPTCGYGGRFYKWMMGEDWSPYNSFGNGSAMRISPVGDIAKDVWEARMLSYELTSITHNHPEGIKGAESAAVAKTMLKNGESIDEVENCIRENYYDVSKTVYGLRRETEGHGQEICPITMPQAFVCLFEGASFEDVIRNCISIGGDSDTIAAIAGGIAENAYPIPNWMKKEVRWFLTSHLLDIVDRWEEFRKEN